MFNMVGAPLGILNCFLHFCFMLAPPSFLLEATNERADHFRPKFIYMFISQPYIFFFSKSSAKCWGRGLKQSCLASGPIFWRQLEPLRTNKLHWGQESKQQLGYQRCCDHPLNSNPRSSAHSQNTCQKWLLPQNCRRKSWTLRECQCPHIIQNNNTETIWHSSLKQRSVLLLSLLPPCWWTVSSSRQQQLFLSVNWKTLKIILRWQASDCIFHPFHSLLDSPLLICQCCI